MDVRRGSDGRGEFHRHGRRTRDRRRGRDGVVRRRREDAFGNSRGVGGDVVSARLLASADRGPRTCGPPWWTPATGRTWRPYVAPATGEFRLDVFLGSDPASGSPFVVDATRAETAAASSYVEEDAILGVAGENNTFVIRAVNAHGVAQADDDGVDDAFALDVSPAGDTFGSFPRGATATRRSAADGGGYLVTWRADRVRYDSDGVPVPYVINVTLGGAHVRGSPFFARLKPARAAAEDTIAFDSSGALMTRDGEAVAVAGETQHFIVQTRDAFSNDATYDAFDPVTLGVSLRGAAGGLAENRTVAVTVRNLLNGIFRLSFAAERAGTYDLRPGGREGYLAENLSTAALRGATSTCSARAPRAVIVLGGTILDPITGEQTNCPSGLPGVFFIQTRDRAENDRVPRGMITTARGPMLIGTHGSRRTGDRSRGRLRDLDVKLPLGESYSAHRHHLAGGVANITYVAEARDGRTADMAAVNFTEVNRGSPSSRSGVIETIEHAREHEHSTTSTSRTRLVRARLERLQRGRRVARRWRRRRSDPRHRDPARAAVHPQRGGDPAHRRADPSRGRTDRGGARTSVSASPRSRDDARRAPHAFDEMMGTSSRKARAQVVDTARAAGMSEIATGILHNVGNLVNSVNMHIDAGLPARRRAPSMTSAPLRGPRRARRRPVDLPRRRIRGASTSSPSSPRSPRSARRTPRSARGGR